MEKLNKILLSPEVIVILFTQTLLFVILSIALYHTLYILSHWVKGSTNTMQYSLEKKSYLVSSVVSFSLMVTLLLFTFFTYTINELASLLPGAMCGAGVVGANSFGAPAVAIKFFIILLSLLWLKLNHQDTLSKDFKYFRKKLLFFLFLYLFMLVDLYLTLGFFTNIDTSEPVLCCSCIYTSTQESQLPFSLQTLELVTLFHLSFVLVITAAYFKKSLLLFVFSTVHIVLSYYAITYFFAPYIYELPSHKCPYCFLQAEYYFVGYFIYASLIMATYYSLSASLFHFSKSSFKKSIFWHCLFFLLVSYKFFFYLFTNKIFL